MSYLGIGLANKQKSSVSAAKYASGVFLRKNGNLGELSIKDFQPSGGRLGMLHLRDCRGGCVRRRLCT